MVFIHILAWCDLDAKEMVGAESMLDFSLLKRGYVEPPPPEQLPAGRRFGRVDTLPARNPANSWPVLQPWPTFDSGLNASQLQAVQLALTNELALIQGPPGTGKVRTASVALVCKLC